MGSLFSLWSSNNDKPTDESRVQKKEFIDVEIQDMDVKYSTIHFSLTDKPLNDVKFTEVLSLHPCQDKVHKLELICNCWITKIPENIGNYTSLCELDLHGNMIDEIQPCIVGLRSTLLCLNLSRNALEYVPWYIGCLGKLKELDLSENDIMYLPKEMMNLTNLEILNMQENLRMISPSVEICGLGKDAIFSAMSEQLEERQNVWIGATRYVDGTDWHQPKTLRKLCYECIINYNIDYSQPGYSLPVQLQKQVVNTKDSFIGLAKCSSCSGYFSSKGNFDSHMCCKAQIKAL